VYLVRDVYLDESQRPGRYLVAAMAVDVRHSASIRRDLRLMAPRGNGVARRHFVKESNADRRKLLAAYRGLNGVDHVVYESLGHQGLVERRARCLDLLLGELLVGGISRVVLDHVDEAQRRRDRRLLARRLDGTSVSYSHEAAHCREPMLWVPDAIAWCAGLAGWRRELEGWVSILQC
jgi:hypothetical protein